MARIHLTAPAGSCLRFIQALGVDSAAQFLDLVRDQVGGAFEVTGNEAILSAAENPDEGGRNDDVHRAGDLTAALADDDVRAIITVRGGSWLSRILPRIDFSVLDNRQRPVALFGFSEATSLVNLVAARRMGRGILDMGPAFIPYGLRRATRPPGAEGTVPDADRVRAELASYFRDVVSMLDGRGSSRTLPVRHIAGPKLDDRPVRFVGGNFAVLTVLLGGDTRGAILNPPDFCRGAPERTWLVLEDINEPPYRLDRYLVHLSMARAWDHVEGLLLGDFHDQEHDDLLPAFLRLLPYHLPPGREWPVVACPRVGHIWPMSPLPLNVPGRFAREPSGEWRIEFPWAELMTDTM